MAMVAQGYIEAVESALSRLPPWSGTVPGGFVANSLGVLTAVEWIRPFIPAADYAVAAAGPRAITTAHRRIADGESFFELAAVLSAVAAASDRFTMIEAGAGWGARSVDAARALALLAPMPCFLTAAEAVPGYYAWLCQHFRTNGLDPARHWLINTAISHDNYGRMMPLAVGMLGNQLADYRITDVFREAARDPATAGTVLQFLVQHSQVKLRAGDGEYPAAFVSCLKLTDLLAPLPVVDYLDMDIQYAEQTVVPQSIEALDARVRLAHIGTHSPAIHAELIQLFIRHGWDILAEFAPGGSHDWAGQQFQTGDGVLTVRNPRLQS